MFRWYPPSDDEGDADGDGACECSENAIGPLDPTLFNFRGCKTILSEAHHELSDAMELLDGFSLPNWDDAKGINPLAAAVQTILRGQKYVKQVLDTYVEPGGVES